MNPQGTIPDPDLRALLTAHADEVMAQLNCAQLARVVSFDGTVPSVSLQILAKRVVFNKPQEGGALQQQPTLVDYPVLTDVPVQFPSGGGGVLFFPLTAGDTGIVLFCDRDIDAWWQAGGANIPNSPRKHSLSDGIFVPCVFGQSTKLPDAVGAGADTVLAFAGAKIRIKPTGEIGMTAGPNGNNVTLNADGSVQITGIGTVNITAVDVNTIHINNGITTLRSILDNLMTTLTLWQNTGGSTPNPATLARIAAVQIEVDSLLS